MSGKPRSRMIRSGCLSVTHLSASAPVSASCTAKPSSSRPARRKGRICTSSSTTRTRGAGSVIRTGLDLGCIRSERQTDRYGGSQIGARAVRLDLAAVGDDESLGDPEPETRARGGTGVARAAEEALTELGLFALGQSGAGIVDREHEVMTVAARRHL